jgi:hypothetical protein
MWIHDASGAVKSWEKVSLQTWDLQPGQKFWVTLNYTGNYDHLEVHRAGTAAEIVGYNTTLPSNSSTTGTSFFNQTEYVENFSFRGFHWSFGCFRL